MTAYASSIQNAIRSSGGLVVVVLGRGRGEMRPAVAD